MEYTHHAALYRKNNELIVTRLQRAVSTTKKEEKIKKVLDNQVNVGLIKEVNKNNIYVTCRAKMAGAFACSC